jgi:hypothetical protein
MCVIQQTSHSSYPYASIDSTFSSYFSASPPSSSSDWRRKPNTKCYNWFALVNILRCRADIGIVSAYSTSLVFTINLNRIWFQLIVCCSLDATLMLHSIISAAKIDKLPTLKTSTSIHSIDSILELSESIDIADVGAASTIVPSNIHSPSSVSPRRTMSTVSTLFVRLLSYRVH